MNELQKKLPLAIKGDRGQDFQWKRPLPPAKVASQDPVAERHQCDHLRLAKKKMHHFTSVLTTVFVLDCSVWYCMVLYGVVLCCIVLFCIGLYCPLLYCIVLYCIVL